MAGPGRKRKNPEMVLTILRTAFLAYVRVLLCLQSLYLGFWAWVFWPGRDPHTAFLARAGLTLLFAFLGLAGIAAALLLRRGRRWAAIAAILIEALWGALAARVPVQDPQGLATRPAALGGNDHGGRAVPCRGCRAAASASPRLFRAHPPLIARAGLPPRGPAGRHQRLSR